MQKVDRYEKSDFVIDTAPVWDGKQPYETAIQHPEYNNGKWIAVEAYNTKEEAQEGHDKWVDIMTAPDLPKSLTDCCNAEMASILKARGNQMEYPRKQCRITLEISPCQNLK